MDSISTVASAIAVISLAIQLAGNAKMLYEFWHSIDEAPMSICALATDLKLLSTVLNNIAVHNQQHGPDPMTTSLLESCIDPHPGLMGSNAVMLMSCLDFRRGSSKCYGYDNQKT
jgi:hypothetical protein